MHVFDISYNQLTGPLPSFLDFTNVPEYAQRGIFISVSPRWPQVVMATLSCFVSLHDREYPECCGGAVASGPQPSPPFHCNL